MKAILYFFSIILLTSYVCLPIMDPDLFWHIIVGRWILSNYSLPTVDYWNIYGVGKEWIAYSWFSEVIYAFLDKNFGFSGVLALKASLIFLFITSLSLSYAYIARNWFIAFLLTLLVVCGSSFHMSLRPQLFPWILFPFLLATLEHVERTTFSSSKILALILIASLWANNHITQIIGVITILFWMPLGKKSFLALSLFIIGTLITPYFGKEWLVFFSKSNHPLSYQLIAEFKPATILEFPTAFLIIITSILLLGISYNKDKVYIPRVLLAFFLIGGSLAVNKFIPFTLIYCSALIARYWSYGGADSSFKSFGEGIKKLYLLLEAIPSKGLAFVFLCLAVVNFNKLFNIKVSEGSFPKHAFDFIEKNELKKPLLNDFGRGGYVIYRTSDISGNIEKRVPIDGRTNIIPKNIWESYTNSFYGQKNWDKFLKLHKPQTILWSMESPFVNLLLATNEWCLAYQQGRDNSGFGVFVKQDSKKADLCKINNSV